MGLISWLLGGKTPDKNLPTPSVDHSSRSKTTNVSTKTPSSRNAAVRKPLASVTTAAVAASSARASLLRSVPTAAAASQIATPATLVSPVKQTARQTAKQPSSTKQPNSTTPPTLIKQPDSVKQTANIRQINDIEQVNEVKPIATVADLTTATVNDPAAANSNIARSARQVTRQVNDSAQLSSSDGLTPGRVNRIKPHERLSHAVNAVGFLLAAGSGLILMYKGFKKLSQGTRSRQVHRVGAALMISAPLVVWLKDWRGWRATWREITHFTAADWEFLKQTPWYLLGFPTTMPPQGKFNAGQKLNFLVVTFNALGFTITGGLLMFRRRLPLGLFPVLIIIHDLEAIVGICGFMAHAYLALLHPDTKPSLSAIIDGTVPVDYAQSHHPLWYETTPEGQLLLARNSVVEGEIVDNTTVDNREI
jgi:formate dehydrogenase subunit gamma